MLAHLLRHGETEGGARYWGRMDVPLSSRGRQQMRAAVTGRSWDLIVSSPLRRCATFAEALGEELGAPCWLEVDLREMSFGEWEGRSAAELMASDAERLRLFWADPSLHSPPGGESLGELHARVMEVWNGLVNLAAGRRILIVTHGGPIRVLKAAQAQISLSAVLSVDVPHAALIGIKWPDPSGPASDPGASQSLPCAEHR